MTYEEFKHNYPYTLKNYSQTDRLFSAGIDTVLGEVETIHFAKSGKAWKETKREKEIFTTEFYFNTIESIPFFRNWGGYEKAEKGNTYYGNFPFIITSIDPWKQSKTVRIFHFAKPF